MFGGGALGNITFARKVLNFNKSLVSADIIVPDRFKVVNPFESEDKLIKQVTESFYNKFYNDSNKRFMILGSNPARRGSVVTGVPFEDVDHLQQITGYSTKGYYVNKASSDFLYEVINSFGGAENFYAKFYMNFVCPLGIVKISDKGKEVNCNYYENNKLKESLYNFIEKTLFAQCDLGIDRSVCFCIGSGENYKFLMEFNERHKVFEKIVSLEHPRFIMQYNSRNKEFYLDKYIEALRSAGGLK